MLAKAHERKALISCSIRVGEQNRKRLLEFGLEGFSVQCPRFSASGGPGGGVCAELRPGAGTRLRDHGGEEDEAAAERRDGPTLHDAHEEPVGNHRLDRSLESRVRTIMNE